MNYNTKDVFLERATANGTFEEYPLRVQPNSVLVTDAYANLAMVTASYFGSGGSGSFNGSASYVSGSSDSVFNTILTTAPSDGRVQAQFGLVAPFYFMSNWPGLGFNAYFDPMNGWVVYGAGSATGSNVQYGAFQSLDPSSGQMNYYFSNNSGSEGQPWDNENLVFAMYPNGQIQFPYIQDGNAVIVGGFLTSSVSLTPPVGIGTNTPTYPLQVYGAGGTPTMEGRLAVDGPIGGAPGISFLTTGSEQWVLYRNGSGLSFFEDEVGNVVNILPGGQVSCAGITASLNQLSVPTGSGTPVNSASVAAWMPVQFNGQTYYMPLYQ